MTDDIDALLTELATLPGRVRALEEMARGGADAGTVAALTALSPRELELLPYIAAGWSNQEIANEVGVTERTMRTHLSTILSKLQTTNRTTVALWALASGRVEMAEAVALMGRFQPHLVVGGDV